MARTLSTLVKIAFASLVTGIILGRLNLSPEQILVELGIAPGNMMDRLRSGAAWAAPHLVLGAMVIVPVWLVVYLFRPPRG